MSKRCFILASLAASTGKGSTPSAGHGIQLQNARGGLLGGADHVPDKVGVVFDQASDQLCAVVHDQVWSRLQRVVQVPLEVLFPRIVGGVDPDAPLGEGRADVVLGGERVAPRDGDLGPRLGEE